MGNAINTVAFPAPQCSRYFYERELLKRPDLVYLTTQPDGEKIPAVHVKANPSRAEPARFTLLYSHGNAEDLGLHLPYIDALARYTGADVFSYEYVGYSLSRINEHRDPSEAGCLRSIDAAWRYCVDELHLDPQRIVIFGRSIGSGPAVDLASRAAVEGCSVSPLNAAGVLLQSPIESGARAVSVIPHFVSVVGRYMDIFRNYEKIDKITAPVAIMHGTADTVVPVTNGKRLCEQLQRPFEPLWLDGYGHNDMPQEECFRFTKRFLDTLAKYPDEIKRRSARESASSSWFSPSSRGS